MKSPVCWIVNIIDVETELMYLMLSMVALETAERAWKVNTQGFGTYPIVGLRNLRQVCAKWIGPQTLYCSHTQTI